MILLFNVLIKKHKSFLKILMTAFQCNGILCIDMYFILST